MVLWIKDRWGRKIWRYQETMRPVMDARVAHQVAKALELSLKRVRPMIAQEWVAADLISKTGTTNDFRTCWFAGATPELTTVLYVGRNDNKPIAHHMFPLKTIFPIWLALNSQLPIKQKKFVYDPTLQEMVINQWTGKRTSVNDSQAITILV